MAIDYWIGWRETLRGTSRAARTWIFDMIWLNDLTNKQIECYNQQLGTWWLIPLSKWVITPVISGLTLLIPFITGVITHLLSGMSHQVVGLAEILGETTGHKMGPENGSDDAKWTSLATRNSSSWVKKMEHPIILLGSAVPVIGGCIITEVTEVISCYII